MGWLDGNGNGEFGIALRGAVVEDEHTVRLYAGCGIVAASDPAAEAGRDQREDAAHAPGAGPARLSRPVRAQSASRPGACSKITEVLVAATSSRTLRVSDTNVRSSAASFTATCSRKSRSPETKYTLCVAGSRSR